VLKFNPAFLIEFYGHMKLCSNLIKELISLPVFTGLTQPCKNHTGELKCSWTNHMGRNSEWWHHMTLLE